MKPAAWTPLRAAAAAVAFVAASCAGSSSPTCTAGQIACGGACVDPLTDAGHCGSCSVSCIAGAACVSGTCGCLGGQTACLGACVDLATDMRNCGSCGHACGLGVCGGGTCVCATTPSTVTLCGAVPLQSCVDVASDIRHCGSCGQACTGGFACQASTCACIAPSATCGTPPSQTCVNTTTDPRNCGACGVSCPPGQVCSASACGCPTGLSLCGPVGAQACVDSRTDPANCGACGSRCPTGQACANGACVASCAGPTCGGLCCPGTECCAGGTTCQSEHDNGVGQKFFDCIAVGAWGPVDGLALARKAAAAWAPQGNDIATNFPCGGTYCLARQKGLGTGGAECGVWCYGGAAQGFGAISSTSAACLCPEQSPATAFGWY